MPPHLWVAAHLQDLIVSLISVNTLLYEANVPKTLQLKVCDWSNDKGIIQYYSYQGYARNKVGMRCDVLKPNSPWLTLEVI